MSTDSLMARRQSQMSVHKPLKYLVWGSINDSFRVRLLKSNTCWGELARITYLIFDVGNASLHFNILWSTRIVTLLLPEDFVRSHTCEFEWILKRLQESRHGSMWSSMSFAEPLLHDTENNICYKKVYLINLPQFHPISFPVKIVRSEICTH